jgi:ribosomal protein S18 acetylase RimI-like enzyme
MSISGNFPIRLMTIADYPALRLLWEQEPGINIAGVDSENHVRRLLERSPGLSLVVEHQGKIVGGVMATEDTRRGYVHHLVVIPELRKHRLGARLMAALEENFRKAGIPKVHLFVLAENSGVISFYEKSDWHRRPDIVLMSKQLLPD